MIRGIDGIVSPNDLEVGRFYLDPGYGAGATLFQWVRLGEREGSPEEGALVFMENDRPTLALQGLNTSGPIVAMPPVSVRVDPPSASGTSYTKQLSRGMFVVESGGPIVAAERAGSRHYWTPINVQSGRIARPGHNWVAFDRWSLVVDEAGEEIAIVSFGEDDAKSTD